LFLVLPVQLPVELLRSLSGIKGFNKETFEEAHASGKQVTSVRMNPHKLSTMPAGRPVKNCQLPIDKKIPWTDYGYYLSERPSFTFDPLFHAGCYYVQEASSMVLELVLKQTADLSKPLKVLDLCAAPGGKSTHLLSLITKNSLLVSNEVIRPRAGILNDNIVKWGCSNVLVTNNDPEDFQQLKNYFDIIVADAPCSGSGLFRKEPGAIKEWSTDTVTHCSRRQQRILADVWPALKKNGILIYSTCSYSKEENEDIVEWLTGEFEINNEEIIINNDSRIISSLGGYRFWPDKLNGEGFFIACFRKAEGEEKLVAPGRNKKPGLSNAETEVIKQWIRMEDLAFLTHRQTVHAVPEKLLNDILFLQSKLRVINSGTRLGEIIRGKLAPDHALAMSCIVSEKVIKTELDYDQAISYLKKKNLNVETKNRDWSLVTYKDHPLGWVNILQNRVNNYYPKELRILKD
jgi:16S rRNA C967 or C1407 C5-methylase (RsmB/RsmF family)/NOL1/NOP2/fmu family ribosome biogenesis protein